MGAQKPIIVFFLLVALAVAGFSLVEQDANPRGASRAAHSAAGSPGPGQAAVRTAFAAAGDNGAVNTTGYAWSDTIGWINVNNTNPDYGVTVQSNGVLDGYAWSDVVGWISARENDMADCPDESACQAVFTQPEESDVAHIAGWAKVLSDGSWISLYNDSDSDGIVNNDLDAPSDYGVTVPADSCEWQGFAWSDRYGWISFRGASYGVSGTEPGVSCSSESATVYEDPINFGDVDGEEGSGFTATGGADSVVFRAELVNQNGEAITGLGAENFAVYIDGAVDPIETSFTESAIEGVYRDIYSGPAIQQDTVQDARLTVTVGADLATASDDFCVGDCGGGGDGGGDGEETGDEDTDSGTTASITVRLFAPNRVAEGSAATLDWETEWSSGSPSGANDICTLSGGEYSGVDIGDLPNGFITTSGLNSPTTYTLECTDYEAEGDTATAAATVTVGVDYRDATIDSFSVSPGNQVSIPAGNTLDIILEWATSDADDCRPEGDWNGAMDANGNLIDDASVGTSGSREIELPATAKTYRYSLVCERDADSDGDVEPLTSEDSRDTASQEVTVTVPSFVLSASESSISTTGVCGSGPNAELRIPDTTVSISPQQDYEMSNINFSIHLDGETGWIESSNLSLSESSASCTDPDPATPGTDSTCTPEEFILSGSLTVKCKEKGQDVEHKEAYIRVTGSPARGSASHANVGLNVQTFTPIFEEF